MVDQPTNQSGFALITVLLVQLMIAGIAYAAIDTAIMGQTQTHASSEAHLAYNGAEQRLVAGMRCIQSAHTNDKSVSTIIDACTNKGLTMEPGTGSDMVLTASDEKESGARRTITLTATPPLMSTLYDANGAYTCFGANCTYEPPSSNASDGADGTDRMLPGHQDNNASPFAQGCGNKGSSSPPSNPDGEDKAGLIMPDGFDGDAGGGKGKKGGGKGGKPSQFAGSPPIVDSVDQFHSLYGEEGDISDDTVDEAEKDLNSRIDTLMPSANTFEDKTKDLAEGETGAWVVKEGQTLSVDKIAGGTVILDGGKLDLTGNTCFAGMVVSRNDGQIEAGGTSTVVGAVQQLAGFRKDSGLNGNASMFYSSSTLEWAKEVSNSTNSGDRWRFGDFQQVTN